MPAPSNFSFLSVHWPQLFASAQEAEQHVWQAPRYAALCCRIALENAVRWLYDHDASLTLPYQDNLAALLHEPTFRRLLPVNLFHGTTYIRKLGNLAAHHGAAPSDREAFDALRYLYGVLAFVATAYSEERPAIRPFDEALLPTGAGADKSLADVQRLEKQYLDQQQELTRQTAALRQSEAEIADLKARLAETTRRRQRNEQRAQTAVALPISEAETRRRYIDLLLREAGWHAAALNLSTEVEVTGMPISTNPTGVGYVDYVLWGPDGRPLAVVEAKRTLVDARAGRHQAALYADCLARQYGQRPVIFYSNGFDTYLWDDAPAPGYPPRPVQGFYTPDELQRLLRRRTERRDLRTQQVNPAIAGRYYQEEAIRRTAEAFSRQQRGALLVMATGSGKTRTAAALVELLMKAGWVKNALFLADRNALVKQAKDAFAQHLPDLTTVNLTREKEDATSRMVFSTYPTMMNLIDGTRATAGQRFYGPGHFDLVIVDEAHRSVYQKYGALFAYFDALLLGLTATPKAEVDKNTYELFGLEDHQPTFAYELSQAVADQYLVPPRALSVPIRFHREGIKYRNLSPAEKAEYELTFRDEETGELREEIDAAALNAWLFNRDTVDKVLTYLLDRGLRVAGGDKLGKTIVFARSHQHAEFIEQRFHKLFPELGGAFLRIIDNQEKYAQDLIDKFSAPDKPPQIAVSVDMLDTGIDIPDLVNLVFLKPVRSSAKFWQMIGRGTRLRPDLFGPGEHKQYFCIFDFCENFEFFDEFPEGLQPALQPSVSEKIFTTRLHLAEALREPAYQTDAAHQQLRCELLDTLHATVASLHPDSFLVRRAARYVEAFRARPRWDALSRADRQDVERHLAPLAPAPATGDELARRFDLLALSLMQALAETNPAQQRYVARIQQLAHDLQTKAAIPAVAQQLPLLRTLQTSEFWQAISLTAVEKVRTALRELVQFVDRQQQPIVYTNFTDEVLHAEVAERPILQLNSVLESYRQRVARYIRENQQHVTIHRLRTNQPITAAELTELERLVFDGQERGTPADLDRELGQTTPLGVFIRSILGLDVNAAKEAFAEFLAGRSLQADQITFINTLIDYLARNGTIDRALLFEPPFTELNHEGLPGIFREDADIHRVLHIVDSINQRARVA